MVTHNMHDAIIHGNKIVMMNEGRIIFEASGEEKKKLTVEELLHKFEEDGGSSSLNDRMILGR